MKIRVTSTALNAGEHAARCIKSVIAQTFTDWTHDYFDAASTDTTYAHAVVGAMGWQDKVRLHKNSRDNRLSVFGNLLPLWRSFDDSDIIVWLDGDDRLATDRALEIVHEMHAKGAHITYGQYIWDDGLLGTAHALPNKKISPRIQVWGASHLKTFRAGLVKRIRDEDFRDASGEYTRFCTDMNVMFPIMEMAPEHAVFCNKVLYAHNSRINHMAQHPEDAVLELTEVRRVRGLERYKQVLFANEEKTNIMATSPVTDSIDHSIAHASTVPPTPRVIPTISDTGYWTGDNIHLAHSMSRPLARWLTTFFAGQEDQLIYDLGCGVGAYLNELRKKEFRVLLGIEGKRPEHALMSPQNFLEHDLTVPFQNPAGPHRGNPGHVICLEVAEHIPPQHESVFLDNVAILTKPQGLLVMSWAVPGQCGDGHVNCRTNDYAIKEVCRRGFSFFRDATESARGVITDEYNEKTGALPWFKNTLLVFKSER